MTPELTLTDYFVSRIYTIEDICKFSISYHSAQDKSFHEVLSAPSSTMELKSAATVVPELIEERWLYVLNGGDYIMLDRYEKSIISSAYLFDKDGNPLSDETLIKQAAEVIAIAVKKDLDKLDQILQEALYD